MYKRQELDYARQYERVKDNALAADTVKLIYEHGTRAVSYTHLQQQFNLRKIVLSNLQNKGFDFCLMSFQRIHVATNDFELLRLLISDCLLYTSGIYLTSDNRGYKLYKYLCIH